MAPPLTPPLAGPIRVSTCLISLMAGNTAESLFRGTDRSSWWPISQTARDKSGGRNSTIRMMYGGCDDDDEEEERMRRMMMNDDDDDEEEEV